MGLYGDWYTFTNREPTRFYVFMKTVITDRNKYELSFELFANQLYSPVFEKQKKKSKNDTSQHNILVEEYTWQHRTRGGYVVIEKNDKQANSTRMKRFG